MNPSKKPHETNLERVMREELQRRGVIFEQFYPTRSGFILDFAFPNLRLRVECDGEKWHKLRNRKGRFRDWILRRGDRRILRFRGSEVLDDVSSCVDRIEWYRENGWFNFSRPTRSP